MSWIDIICGERTQLLSTQASIVSERKHHSIAQWFQLRYLKNRSPLLLIRQPWLFLVPWNESPLTSARKSLTRCVTSPSHRVILAVAFFHQIVVKKADNRDSLLKSRIG